MKMASSYKTIHYISLLERQAYNKAVALILEWLYDKPSDIGIDYKAGC